MGIITPRAGSVGEPAKVKTSVSISAGDQMVINSAGTKLYFVSNNAVKVMNLASNTITKSMSSTISLAGPIGISPDGTTLYALTGNSADSTCPTFSLATETQSSSWYAVHTGFPGGFFANNSSGLYVVHSLGYPATGRYRTYIRSVVGPGSGGVEVGDNVAFTGAMLARSIAVTESTIYIFGNFVGIFDIATWTLSSTVNMGGGNNWSCAINPAKTKIYASYGGNELKVFSTATNTVTGTVTAGAAGNMLSYPFGIVFNNAGTRAYAANYSIFNDGNYYVSVIDTSTDTVISKIRTVANAPSQVAISPDGKTLYVYGSGNTGQYIDVIAGIGAPSTNLEVSSSLVRSSTR